MNSEISQISLIELDLNNREYANDLLLDKCCIE